MSNFALNMVIPLLMGPDILHFLCMMLDNCHTLSENLHFFVLVNHLWRHLVSFQLSQGPVIVLLGSFDLVLLLCVLNRSGRVEELSQ